MESWIDSLIRNYSQSKNSTFFKFKLWHEKTVFESSCIRCCCCLWTFYYICVSSIIHCSKRLLRRHGRKRVENKGKSGEWMNTWETGCSNNFGWMLLWRLNFDFVWIYGFPSLNFTPPFINRWYYEDMDHKFLVCSQLCFAETYFCLIRLFVLSMDELEKGIAQ